MEKGKIQMVDLVGQYNNMSAEINATMQSVVESGQFIGGKEVLGFENELASFLDVNYVISCANGTDALQIACMALGLKAGDEVIVPAFTFQATAEILALLGIKIVPVDVCLKTFNMDIQLAEKLVNEKTKAIIPVHLFGQSADMEAVLNLAKEKNLFVIEDNAQSIACEYTFRDGTKKMTGTMGDIGTFSFFPSKNLGCYGDGGAVCTNNKDLSKVLRMISKHGQREKYKHEIIGVNSRLDALQAAVLNVKLKYLNDYTKKRQSLAELYDAGFAEIKEIAKPFRIKNSSHVFHQYTIQIKNGKRNELKQYLNDLNIPSMIYYPIPLYKQRAYKMDLQLENTEELCQTVLSLPMHTEMTREKAAYIIKAVTAFFSD